MMAAQQPAAVSAHECSVHYTLVHGACGRCPGCRLGADWVQTCTPTWHVAQRGLVWTWLLCPGPRVVSRARRGGRTARRRDHTVQPYIHASPHQHRTHRTARPAYTNLVQLQHTGDIHIASVVSCKLLTKPVNVTKMLNGVPRLVGSYG